MGLDYDKIKGKTDEHSFWVSYSDLFLMLSMVFLLLFVLASLRNGAQGIQQNIENKQLTKRTQELEEQIKVYSALKDEQLKQTSQSEQEVYSKLMDKLSLLKEDAGKEKVALRKQAKENEEKEFALNEYQQVIRNIIDANVLAKAQINRRDTAIKVKNEALTEKDQTITGLNQEVEEKQAVITANEDKIEKINGELGRQIQAIQTEQKHAKISKEKMKQQITALKTASQKRIDDLESQNNQVRTTLTQAQQGLNDAQGQLQQASATIAAKEAEKSALEQQLEGNKGEYQKQIGDLKGKYQSDMEAARGAFNKQLRDSQMGAAEKAQRLAAFQAQSKAKENELNGKLAGLNQAISDTNGKLAAAERGRADAEAGQGRAVASLQNVTKEKDEISANLKKAQAKLNAQRDLSKAIRDNFRKAGIPAEVNDQTGDVTLAFGDDYFDSGSARLTTTMQNTLNKFIPTYSKGLFTNPATAGKIANVEIVGFASSTYKGKFVNPTSLKPEDREAVNYNLKLSFDRANAIFKHIFDTKKLQYTHQKDLLPLVKVVGRGYLPEGKQGTDIAAGITERDFCQKYNCKKAQKVIIKFNLKDE